LKRYISIAFLPAAIYILFSIAGFGLSGVTGSIVYKIVIIVHLLFACSLVFKEAGNRVTMLIGALGLGLLAVNEVFLFAYIHLFNGSTLDITVANYSRNCAYLFFLAALLSLLPPALKWKKVNQIGANGLSAAVIILIFYGVLTDQANLLYYAAITMMVLCTASALLLLAGKNRNATLFAISIIIACVLDAAYHIFSLLNNLNLSWYWQDIVMSLYPAVYLFIGFALIRLKEEEADNG
jgi:hypothetical protein